MKHNNQVWSLGRVRSFLFSFTLAAVMVFSFSGCADKSADEIRPTSKDAATKADIVLVTHYIKVWIPANSGIRHINIRGQYIHTYCYPVYTTGGYWYTTNLPAVQGDDYLISLRTSGDCYNPAKEYGSLQRRAPGPDGHKYWWVTVPKY